LQAIETLDISDIVFEPQYKNRQELELHFNNVQRLDLTGLNVVNTLKLKAVNVKEARFVGTIKLLRRLVNAVNKQSIQIH